jgi:hypothetical protein
MDARSPTGYDVVLPYTQLNCYDEEGLINES